MPKRKSVRSLQELCLEKIARNLERVWIKDYTDDCLGKYHVLPTSQRLCPGPEVPHQTSLQRDAFSFHPAGFLVHELLQFMGKRKLLTAALLGSLLVPQLKTLDLSICPQLVTKAVVTPLRCKNLSTLVLQDCNQIPAGTLLGLIKALPRLLKLNISSTQCNTQVLSAVASCCRQLRELDISGCQRLSPYSLFHLAYNPSTGSFCCSGLQILVLGPLNPRINREELVWALVFLLLALPNLRSLVHEQLAEAVCLIYHHLFEDEQVPPAFPSLAMLARCRGASHPDEAGGEFSLALEEIRYLNESSWPMVRAVCPRVRKVAMTLAGMPVLGESFLSTCRIAHLTVGCREKGDLREVLPLAQSLRLQLDYLSIFNFAFEDELTFHTLLSHCLNVQKLSIRFLSPTTFASTRRVKMEALTWDRPLPPHPFPYLCKFCLVHSDEGNPLPSRHAALLRECLESLLKHSPCLEVLELVALPFSLDEVFEKVLQPPGQGALAQLRQLSLVEGDVSLRAIHLLLSAENQLSCLSLDACPGMEERAYQEVCQRVAKEGLDVEILWA
ncbi:hypothetical protein JRQ81_003494 [Phrynocephalus forsythii]|uniref:Uncharacterized protein n=1 Tax=Phrynocephalus forsythii TaxID=171643 RepID=A0A9Q0XKB3_9SAUR|nr:hypothetical protein JRQ81_003494 [Phrynocephalus forsythii]